MEKVKLIDPNQYFTESKKAIQIVLEKEKSLFADLPKQDKLNLLRKRKKETNSPEEYDHIEKLEKQLEKEIKFNFSIPLVPDEYREMLMRNVNVEKAEADKKLKEITADLKNQLPYLQKVLLPLLVNNNELKNMSTIPHHIDTILKFDFQEGRGLRAANLIHQMSGTRNNQSIKKLKEIIDAIASL